MKIDVNSPDFEKAWRMVSEALLQLIQSTGTTPPVFHTQASSTDLRQSADQPNPTATAPASPAADHTKSETKYAVTPIRQPDGSYIFKKPKVECQTDSTFKLTIYTDDTCKIEIRDSNDKDYRQGLKDSLRERLPAAVGTFTGSISPDGPIRTIKPGKGEVVNKFIIRIVEPLEAEFK